MSQRVVITVVGKDLIGIIARVATVLAQNQVNIQDISQTILQDFFTMIMIADLTKCPIPLSEVAAKLDEVGKELGLDIRVQHEDIFNYMHRV